MRLELQPKTITIESQVVGEISEPTDITPVQGVVADVVTDPQTENIPPGFMPIYYFELSSGNVYQVIRTFKSLRSANIEIAEEVTLQGLIEGGYALKKALIPQPKLAIESETLLLKEGLLHIRKINTDPIDTSNSFASLSPTRPPQYKILAILTEGSNLLNNLRSLDNQPTVNFTPRLNPSKN